MGRMLLVNLPQAGSNDILIRAHLWCGSGGTGSFGFPPFVSKRGGIVAWLDSAQRPVVSGRWEVLAARAFSSAG
jgi:hypothetical protein